MRYIIYELTKSIEPRVEYKDYLYTEVLERLDAFPIEEEHLTMESAIETIEKNKERLKHKRLTILPIYNIDWEGEIR